MNYLNKNAMKLKSIGIVTVLALGMFACGEKEVNPNGEVTLVAKANTSSGTSISNGRVTSNLTINDFVINLREVEFEFDNDKMVDSTFKDIKLKGPFELDLINNQSPADLIVGSATLPNAAYSEIEFKLHKGDVAGSKMDGKSIHMSGTIDGTPFVFWHDTDEEFEINFSDAGQNFVVNGEDLNAVITFNLGSIFDAISGVDLSIAEDEDGNGIIEIDPKNTDGNKDIADHIKKLLEEKTDLIDDKK